MAIKSGCRRPISNLAAAEVELVPLEHREYQLRKVLSNLDYDYILIDCPPSLGLLSINALVAATDVLIPVQTEFYAMEGLGQVIGNNPTSETGIEPLAQSVRRGPDDV